MPFHQLVSSEELEEEKIVHSRQMIDNLDLSHELQSFKEQQRPTDGNKVTSGRQPRRERIPSSDSANFNRGHWSFQENKRYHWFLELHFQHFVNRHLRRMDKIFKSMEIFVGTRQAEQCRSHHQKMEKKYHHFVTIIYNLRLAHYSTLDPTVIATELTQANIPIIDDLAESAQLTNTPPTSNQCKTLSPKKKGGRTKSTKSINTQLQQILAIDNAEHEEEREQLKSQNVDYMGLNMLQQSNNHRICELMLYPERDDHEQSNFLNEMFQ